MISKQISLTSIKQTEALASAVGKNLVGGECIEFVSDLGGGKTTFVRSLVSAAGSKDNVSSPTFTISKLYKTPSMAIYHYDFYRLSDPGLAAEELAESVEDKSGVVLVEWGQNVQDVLPAKRVIVKLSKSKSGPDVRLCSIECPSSLEYLFSGADL